MVLCLLCNEKTDLNPAKGNFFQLSFIKTFVSDFFHSGYGLLEWAGFNIGCVRCSWAVLVGCFKRAGFGYVMLRSAGMH